MSLDKWLGKEEEKEEDEEEPGELKEGEDGKAEIEQQRTLIPQKKEEQGVKERKEEKESGMPKLTKYLLSCSNSNCKYKKTLMKRRLTREDKVCPRCKSEMNVKKA